MLLLWKERNFSIKKEYYHCGSGVDSIFAGYRDVWTQKKSVQPPFLPIKNLRFFGGGSACTVTLPVTVT
jgi:hypothetical protein